MRAKAKHRARKPRRATLTERTRIRNPRDQAASSPMSFCTIASAAGPALISEVEDVMT